MPTLSQLKQVAEIETRYTVTGEADVRRSLDGVANAQDRVAKGAQAVAVATETVEKKQLNQAKGADTLRARYDELFRAQQRQQTDLNRISGYEARGLYDPTVADSLRASVMAKYGNDNRRSADGGLSSYDKGFIKYQGFDVASSLGAGASPLTVAFQQGPQVLQQLADREGGLSAGLKQLGVSAAALVTPFSIALVAATALGGGFVYAAVSAGQQREAMERATKGIGAATGATAGQLDALARANAEAGKVSTSTARDMVASYNSTGQIGTGVFGTLIQSTEKYARLTGQDTTAATQDLARAFGDLTTGADAIAAKIGGLDDKTRQLIQTQIEQGDKAAAQVTAGEYLKSTVDANSTATTGWAAAWDRAKAAADGYWEAAKRIAGIKLGVAPEGATEAVERLRKEVDNINARRTVFGQQPLDPETSSQARELQVAEGRSNQERLIAEANAARERAATLSRTAGDLARGSDPNFARLSQLNTETSNLRDALSDPFTRGRMNADTLQQTTDAYISRLRAIDSLTDGNNKLISSEEMSRRQDQLRLDAVNATTAAEKASVAERQKAFDLIGKTVTRTDAAGQIERAGILARASASSGGGSGSEALDEYDRATKSLDDRIRRQGEEATTYGQTADAVARYRAEQDLLVAAKRAERDLTPTLLADIRQHGEDAANAAKRLEEAREISRRADDYRSIGSDGVRTLARDLADGATAGKMLTDVLGSLKIRLADMAATSLSDALFGRRGSSDLGLLGSLIGGSGSSAAATGGGLLSSLFGGWMPHFADGGMLYGPGGPRSDNLLIRASPGEYVINADAAGRHRGLLDHINGGGGFRPFADGGFVPSPSGEFGESAGFGEILT